MRDVYALFLHGIGTQDADFADEAKLHLDQGLRKFGAHLYARSVHYAPLLDGNGSKFLKQVEKHGSRGNITQQLAIMTLTDALQYRRNKAVTEQIMYLLDYEYSMLRDDGVLHIFAHSLGCLVALDWIRSRDKVRRVKLYTLGCNVGLFEMGTTIDVPYQVEQPGDWTNLFDPSDGIGFPIALDDRPELCAVQDVKVQVGGLITGNTGLAHMAYFGDEKLWRTTIPLLVSQNAKHYGTHR